MKQHAEKCRQKVKEWDTVAGIFVEGECDCDGYHTFNELYDHRIALWIKLCNAVCGMSSYAESIGRPDVSVSVWRSKNHSDGEPSFGGTWFVLGIGKASGSQMTYHLPIAYWDSCDFAETLDKAPEFDGHTSDDVLERLKTL